MAAQDKTGQDEAVKSRTGKDQTVAIVGGAIIGSSIAWFLREKGFDGRIVVIERDRSYQHSSTALSAASIRSQFGCAVNVEMSLFGADFIRSLTRRFGPGADIGFVERGYLFLGAPGSQEDRRAGAAMQRAAGAEIAVLSPSEVKSRHPWLHVEDLAIATSGIRNEGWFDAWSLLSLMRRSARERGVDYLEAHAEVFERHDNRIVGVRLQNGETLACDRCVVAAGAASGALVRGIGIDLPVSPRKRTVFHVKAPVEREGFPMLFDTSGFWLRPEGEGFICGIAPEAANDPDATGDFEPDHAQLEATLWPALAHRIPAFEELRVLRAWAGHYEVNALDHNAVIGPHDEIENLLFATGFSGHGVQHAPATGRAVAELIVDGGFTTLDLTSLGFPRIRTHTPLRESIVY